MSNSAVAPFLLGVNYPWAQYGHDFGLTSSGHTGVSLPGTYDRVARDFVEIRSCGVQVVRWFLFGDGRGGFITDRGIPRSPDALLLKDVGAALQLAESAGVKLCLSLMDYLWLQDRGRDHQPNDSQRVLQFAAGREALLERVLLPLFCEFRGHPALFAWEIANEPEWAIREFNVHPFAKVAFAEFRAFAEEIVRAVHEYAGSLVTLGSARLIWFRAWSELGLDFYQAHYYPAAERETKAELAKQLASLPRLDQPLWLGELPARDPSSLNYSLEAALGTCRSAGLLGAAVWRWTEPTEKDRDIAIGRVEPAMLRGWQAGKQAQGQSV